MGQGEGQVYESAGHGVEPVTLNSGSWTGSTGRCQIPTFGGASCGEGGRDIESCCSRVGRVGYLP